MTWYNVITDFSTLLGVAIILNLILLNFNITAYNWWISFVTITFILFLNVYLLLFFPFIEQQTQSSIYVDSTSLVFILLSVFITWLCYIWIHDDENNYFDNLVLSVILLCLINIFSTTNILYFFIFFEFSAIPLILLIGIKGPSFRKTKAVYYFFGYTVLGSCFLLLSIILIFIQYQTVNIFEIKLIDNWYHQTLIWIGFIIAFSIKTPVMPFHLWLLEAHVEAPTIGSVLLAAIFLKVGSFGFIRFCLELLPQITNYYSPVLKVIFLLSTFVSTISVIYQLDIKRIIAYSSIAHMNFSTFVLFLNAPFVSKGAVLSFLAHGLASSGLFFFCR